MVTIGQVSEETVARMKAANRCYIVLEGQRGMPREDVPYVCIAAKTGHPDNKIYQWMVNGQVVKEFEYTGE